MDKKMNAAPQSAELSADERAAIEAKAKRDEAQIQQANSVHSLEKTILDQIHKQRKVRIIIPSGRGSTDKGSVLVGLNGVPYLIQRDKEVEVPEGLVNVLNDAKETQYEPQDDGIKHKIVTREALRFPFQVLGYVDEPQGESAQK